MDVEEAAPAEEAATEAMEVEETEAPAEAEPMEEESPAEPEAAAEETAAEPEAVAEEEDGPLEDWTKKELAEECKTLGLSDKGNKAALIERIKEHRAAKEAEVAAPEEEAVAAVET